MGLIKSAIIGTGFMGRVHLEAACRIGTAEPVLLSHSQLESCARGPGNTSSAHLHAERAHIPLAEAALRGGKARAVREAAGHFGRGRRAAGRTCRPRAVCATAPSTTCATTPWCSRCAACARPANWARFWWCREPTRRTGCSTTPIGTGASIPSTTAPRAAWPISARTGATWPNTSPGSASPALCADLQTFHKTRKQPKGPIETFAGKTLTPRRLRGSCRSTPKISARWFSAWASAPAAPSPPARCRPAARTG